jgi:hypothetical protein
VGLQEERRLNTTAILHILSTYLNLEPDGTYNIHGRRENAYTVLVLIEKYRLRDFGTDERTLLKYSGFTCQRKNSSYENC